MRDLSPQLGLVFELCFIALAVGLRIGLGRRTFASRNPHGSEDTNQYARSILSRWTNKTLLILSATSRLLGGGIGVYYETSLAIRRLME